MVQLPYIFQTQHLIVSSNHIQISVEELVLTLPPADLTIAASVLAGG